MLLHAHVMGSGGSVSEAFYRTATQQADQKRSRVQEIQNCPQEGALWVGVGQLSGSKKHSRLGGEGTLSRRVQL